jgi:hypothetical protein
MYRWTGRLAGRPARQAEVRADIEMGFYDIDPTLMFDQMVMKWIGVKSRLSIRLAYHTIGSDDLAFLA